MSFLVLPPEINSVRMFSGAGSAPLLEAAAAWNTLASELDSAAGSFSAMTSGLAGEAWQGAASKAMLAAAAPYAGWLSTAATQAFGASAQAQAVAGAFESALAATVHPVMVAANRSDLVSLVLSNLFGQNAPAIAAAESVYEEMWAQDVAAMVEYHAGAAAAAAQLVLPAQALHSLPGAGELPNFGYGNVGQGNIGFFNTGTLNVGISNISPNFTPTDPITLFGGVGIANNGLFNVGAWNNGSVNVGIANTSPHFTPTDPITQFGGFGIANNGINNVGIANVGTNNGGLPLGPLSLLGVGNHGNFNQGFFNTGNHNLGAFLTGDNLIGIGPFHINR
uniref:Putative PPE family protein PPE42 n=1 Tax=Mycobacterium riyadhense TaxID=486698 RepID=A0A653F3K1_9MYCO|nr:PPE family protein [Mycobacterium riyadhense]VTP03572.1 putative PPE family protein PPE42 [Mycobacterium riyadhense]